MITDINGGKIYFDANFLIYWFISKEPELKKRTRCLLAKFLVNKNSLHSSPLAFDEAWWGIKNEYNQQNNVNLACFDSLVFNELEKFTNAILPKLKVIQFSNANNYIINALNHIKNFKLNPRDAFHLTVMKDNNINVIATGDDDFIKNQQLMGILVQSIL